MTFAFVFPGQGSQSIGMLAAFAAGDQRVLETFAEASATLGYDLWALCQSGPEALLNETERTQPALLTASVATWRLWRSNGGGLPQAMAGHSLGEYSALVAAGCLEFSTAVDLVRFRGAVMQAAVPAGVGTMAAILGLDDADVEAACIAAAQGEVVEAANFNSPGQVVIAGHTAAVERAILIAKEKGAKRAIKLPVSAPFHSSLMQPAAERMAVRLKTIELQPPVGIDLYSVDFRKLDSADAIRSALVAQLVQPVRWTGTVRAMRDNGIRTFIECGPGKVLTGLNRRIERDKSVEMLCLEDPASLATALQVAAITDTLRNPSP